MLKNVMVPFFILENFKLYACDTIHYFWRFFLLFQGEDPALCPGLHQPHEQYQLWDHQQPEEQGDPHQQWERPPAGGEGRPGEEPQEALHVHKCSQLEEVQQQQEEGDGAAHQTKGKISLNERHLSGKKSFVKN